MGCQCINKDYENQFQILKKEKESDNNEYPEDTDNNNSKIKACKTKEINKIKIGQYTYCIEEIYSNIKKIKIIVGSLYYIYTVEIDLDSNDTKITKYQKRLYI